MSHIRHAEIGDNHVPASPRQCQACRSGMVSALRSALIDEYRIAHLWICDECGSSIIKTVELSPARLSIPDQAGH